MLKRTPIVAKPKKCNAEGKAKGFNGCGEMALFRQYGLCKGDGTKNCFYKWLADSQEGNKMISKAIDPIKQKRDDFEKAKKDRSERKSISYLLTNVKNIAHEYVRLRDYGKPCISCNGLWQSDFQCGHFYKAELYSTLKFDEKNLSGQCVGCNIRNDGNESGYRVGIINRYGKEHLDYLDDKAAKDHQESHKWDREQLELIRKFYTAKKALITKK